MSGCYKKDASDAAGFLGVGSHKKLYKTEDMGYYVGKEIIKILYLEANDERFSKQKEKRNSEFSGTALLLAAVCPMNPENCARKETML